MDDKLSLLEWVGNYGVMVVIAAVFLVIVWMLFNRWMKTQDARDEKEDKRYDQLVSLTKTVTEVASQTGTALESNTRVIEGMQSIVEEVGKTVDTTNKTLGELTCEVKDQKALTNKMFTELRVQGERSRRENG